MSNELTIKASNQVLNTSQFKVRELKESISLEKAIEATQNNGFDEVFFEADGKRFVAYTDDSVSLPREAALSYKGQAAKVLHFNNEINTCFEGLATVPKLGYKIASTALSPLKTVFPNTATNVAIAGGVVAGMLTRASFTPSAFAGISSAVTESGEGVAAALAVGVTGALAGGYLGAKTTRDIFGTGLGALLGAMLPTVGGAIVVGTLDTGFMSKSGGLGMAAGALAGVATVTAISDTQSKTQTGKTVRAAATGIGSVALGAAAPEIVNLIAKIHVPEILAKSAKAAGVAALAGGTLITAGLGLYGAMKKADAASLDAIAQ